MIYRNATCGKSANQGSPHPQLPQPPLREKNTDQHAKTRFTATLHRERRETRHEGRAPLYTSYSPLGGWVVVAGLIAVCVGVPRGILRDMGYYRAGGNVVMRGVS
jgi:hypothetical protein